MNIIEAEAFSWRMNDLGVYSRYFNDREFGVTHD